VSDLPDATMPAVSVVVAAHARPRRLGALLESLAGQSLPAWEFEVVVVDDASSDAEVGRVLSHWEGSGRLRLRRLRQPQRRGPAAARNAGWRTALAPLVAFTDDDCAVEAEWLRAGLAAWRGREEAFVQGRTVPEETRPQTLPLFWRTIRVERPNRLFETCNMFYARRLLERLEGFDERYGLQPAGEDTDLGWRALEVGAEAVWAPEAVVRHAVEAMRLRDMVALARRPRDAVALFARRPAARENLFRGLFWDGWHYLWWRSLLALALPRPLRRVLLGRHLRRVAARAREGGVRGRGLLWAIPLLLALDGVECVTVLRGSLRHRTLVL
jgi:glycosyltransferase involved in cell wall biosynthesis